MLQKHVQCIHCCMSCDSHTNLGDPHVTHTFCFKWLLLLLLLLLLFADSTIKFVSVGISHAPLFLYGSQLPTDTVYIGVSGFLCIGS
jgi:hypothetical protein